MTQSSWMSILAVAVAVALLPSTTFLVRSAYGFVGDSGVPGRPGSRYVQASDGNAGPTDLPDEAKQLARQGLKVALQAGHWKYAESPPPLNTSTGASGGGKTESEVTLEIAQRTAKILTDLGYTVDILPAWFQEGYKADAVVAIHADGSDNQAARGFFADRSASTPIPKVDDRFKDTMDAAYKAATGLTFTYRTTVDSRNYYGYRLIQPKTPMVLIETGFLTNEGDRGIIVGDPDKAAQGIASGIDKFLLP